ncbi:MAG: hypothetical protein KJO29_06345, partial [Bacteroidia bacterium]|nr:hypothetical protein [Bacteroidia bacterium]
MYNFEIFELPGGQSANSVQAIVQDSFGFMWFGTQFGLYRWDGYSFKAFLNDPEDSLSVASNHIECLIVGKDGTLWVGHWGKGLSFFNHKSETFEHINFQQEDSEKNVVIRVNSITEGSDGDLWIGTGKGLYKLNKTSREMKLYQHDPDDVHSLSYNLCRVTYVDRNGTLWVGTGFPWFGNNLGGLNRYRLETDDFVRFLHDPEDPYSLTQNKVSALFEDSRGNFWVGTNGDGLHIMDRKTGKFQRLQQDPNSPNQLCAPFINNDNSRHVRFFMEDLIKKIWIGALQGGIKYYDPETGYVKDYFNKENDPQSLPEQNAWTLFQSKDGTYWAASNGPTWKAFKFRETSFLYHNLPDEGNTVYSFSESRDNNIWLGTDQGGLLKYIKRTQKIIEYDVEVSLVEPYNSNYNFNQFQKANKLNFFLKSVEDQDGNLWIRKFLPVGLFRLNIATGVMTYFENDPEDSGSIAPGRVTDILIDGEERLWSITSSGHLNHYNSETEKFIKYRFLPSSKNSFELNGYFLSAQSKDGKIWISGTGIDAPEVDPMLLRFDADSKTFEEFDSDFLKSDIVFRNETIQGIAEDDEQNVWLCSDTKLIKYKPLTGEHVSYRAEELGALFFKSMIFDRQERLWLFGDKITLFDPESEISSNYVASYNMQPNANYTQYVFMDSKGLIYFGGKEGFQVLEPRKIGMNDNIQPVETIIENFQFLDENSNVDLKENNSIHAITDDKISLKYDQNAFTFNFGALDFENPENNRHEFMLEGYDEGWRSTGSDPIATYVKVPPGNYTFKVRGATLRSEWGPEDNIKVHISAPWWSTWWAYIAYGLITLGILYAFYNIQVNRRLDQAEADRLKELDTVKTRLYTNITHEFRTPLTVISGMASQIKDNPKEWFNEGIVMIQRNTNRLLDLVNQMLDLSKLESGKLMMNPKQGDIVNFIKYIIQSVHSFAETKNIEIHFYAEDDQVIMDFDHEKIQQIMTNLLSNAIKFTPEGGNIYSSIEIKDEANIKISVRDTGQGIVEKDLPYIFDRFYQVDATATRHGEGTG